MTQNEMDGRIRRWLAARQPGEVPASLQDAVTGIPFHEPRSWLSVVADAMLASRPARRFADLHTSAKVLLAAAAALVVAVLGIDLMTGNAPGGGPESSPTSSPLPSPSQGTDLGVFEPVRGWIVFRVGSHLEAVDPLDPSSPIVIEPGDLGLGTGVMPAGWSADGSKLALSDEGHGESYVMDQTGSLNRVPFEELPEWKSGCCSFVASAWLSPDGTEGLAFAPPDGSGGPGRLYILDLDDIGRSRVVEVEQFEWAEGGYGYQDSMPVWSPDGSQVAYVWSKGGNLDNPAVGVLDLGTGASRELVSGWGLIRQLAWSPDGSQLLVVAGRIAPGYGILLNPLVHPQSTSLYLVDIDDAELHEIASGHYVAAAWSPDGAQIAAIDYPGKREVVVINADGSGAIRVLAELPATELSTGVVWHPVPAP